MMKLNYINIVIIEWDLDQLDLRGTSGMRKLSFVILGLFVSGCEQSVPSLDLRCVRNNQEITFRSDSETNSIIGSDGTSTEDIYDDMYPHLLKILVFSICHYLQRL